MKITKAYYFHTFPNPVTGQWQKIGLEAELTEIDDYRQCLYELKRHVTDFYYESNKAAEKEEKVNAIEPIGTVEGVISLINKCKTIEKPFGVKAYELLAKNNPQLQDAYDKKIKELTV